MGISLDVNFCKDHRDKIEVPDPLAVEDLIRSTLNNKNISQYCVISLANFRLLNRMCWLI